MFKKGRDGDFETAVRPEMPLLFRVARRLALSREDCEDLVQSTLMSAARHWHRFDGTFLRSWLIRIMRNHNLNEHRRSASRIQTEGLPEDDLGPGDCVWNEIAWRYEAHRVLDALKSLPEEFRLAVHLCDVEEFAYEEAARALDVPVGTVRSRLSRGRARLRAILSEEVGPE